MLLTLKKLYKAIYTDSYIGFLSIPRLDQT